MEQQEEISSSRDAVKGDEAPASFIAAARSENPGELSLSGSTMPPPAVAATPVSVAMPGTEVKKKRGRPRKYGPGGSAVPALSPMPISASIPLTGEFSAWKQGRGRSINSFKKKHKLELGSPGEWASYFFGANFTPHVMTVYTGEDVSMKILSFSQQESRAVCVLSANGAISNVTLRQANSCGGTLTYEGRFEILSLTGSFMPSDGGGTRSRSGGMSVSLAGPDGRVFGGGLAGLLVAAGPVQVVIGSFSPGHRQEQKPKKQRFERTINFSLPPANHHHAEPAEVVYGGPKPNLTAPSSFHGDSMGTPISSQVSKNLANENETPLPRAEPKDPNLQDREISC